MVRLLLLILLSSLFTGCATNPVTGKNEIAFVSEREEIAIGQQHYVPTQQAQGGQYTVDEELTAYVQEVGNRLAAVSDRPLPYEFVVINDSTPNAWALPGGKIAINRGLLLSLESEAELAAVLGHEIVHAAARHGAKAMERNLLLQGAVALTAISTSDNEYSNYIVGGASLGAQLLSQGYSREAEMEADRYGIKYMVRAGYDPNAAITLQEKFVALKNGRQSSWLEGLFASHPPSQERVQKNTETATLLAANTTADLRKGDRQFQQELSYLAAREDAYRAFDQARTLYAEKEYDVALSRINRAINLEPKEARFYGLKADIELAQQNYRTAINHYNDALNRDDSFYQYYLGRGLSFSRIGNRERARSDLEKSNELLPTAQAANELGNLSLAAGNRNQAKQYFAQVANTGGQLGQNARRAFVELDLSDNPANYFQVTSDRSGGQFRSLVSNRSGLDVKRTVVDFYAIINGEAVQRRVDTGPIRAGQQMSVLPGWTLGETDTVTNVTVEVIYAVR